MGLPDREIRLAELLLRHTGGLTAEGAAQRLGVSSRTVHRELQPVSAFLESRGLTLVRQSGRGLSVEGDSETRERALESLSAMRPASLSPQERQLSLISTLISARQPIKLRALASGLDVAIGTVTRDLDDSEEWLSEFGLSLVRKRNYGVEISGTENDRRQAISRLIFRHLDETALLAYPGEPEGAKGLEDLSTTQQTNGVAGQLMTLIDEDRLRRIRSMTQQMVRTLPYSIADGAFASLTVHVALMVERRLTGGDIEMGADMLARLQSTEEYAYASRLARDLEESFDVTLPAEEVGYITVHLRGTKLREDETLEGYFETSDLEVASQVKALIRYVEDETGVELASDSLLYTGLLAHIERAIQRLGENMSIHNPLLAEVKRDYPALFELVSQGMTSVFVRENIPEEEVGFVAMHFGAALDSAQGNFPQHVLALCSSGIATSRMLASRLEKAFPQIQTIKNSSLFDLDGLDVDEYDLVVSTVPLPMPDDSYVQVQPFLSGDEVERIRNHLLEKSISSRPAKRAAFESLKVFGGGQERFHRMVESTQVVAELVDDAFLTHHEAGGSLSEAVRLMCGQLAEKGLVQDPQSLEESLLSRMRLGGVGIPGTMLALFHARNESVPRPSFSVHAFDEPLGIKGLDDTDMHISRSLLMIAPLNLSQVALEAISEISAAMVEQPAERAAFESGSERSIIEALEEIFGRYLHGKIS